MKKYIGLVIVGLLFVGAGCVGAAVVKEGAVNDYDMDHDGWTVQTGDCNDTNADINPGVTEVCNEFASIDEDCDPKTVANSISLYVDTDGDGYGDPGRENIGCGVSEGFVIDNTDCDDTNPEVNPGEEEKVFDGPDPGYVPIDEDCDGQADEYDAIDENLTSYDNDRLKISFSYPKKWGATEEKNELPLIGQVTLVLKGDIFLSADNGYRGGDRGGYWGDYASFLKDQSTITNFCKEPFTYPERIKSCAVLTNNNGITYAKTQEEICTEGGCSGLAVNYYLYNPNSEFRGLVISSDRLKDNNILQLEEKLDELVNNLNFVK